MCQGKSICELNVCGAGVVVTTPCDDNDPCTVDDRMGNGACVGTPLPDCAPVAPIPCISGEAELCAPSSCSVILKSGQSQESGFYWLDWNADETGDSVVYCDMEIRDDGKGTPNSVDPGGWTLVAVSSDDCQETWTWTNRHLWDDETAELKDPVDKKVEVLKKNNPHWSSLATTNRDFKSKALYHMNFRDILVIHYPSEVWAVYRDVGVGDLSLADLIGAIGSQCYYVGGVEPCVPATANGYPMTTGTLTASSTCDYKWNVFGLCLCDTALYINPKNSAAGCGAGAPWHSDTWGLAWNGRNNDCCPLDDPGQTSLGPSRAENVGNNWHEYEYGLTGYGFKSYCWVALGFGGALGLNTAHRGTGGNYVQVFVR